MKTWHVYFQIKILKQNKQKQKHDTCETIIQRDFIAKKQKTKQGHNKKTY
jgi:hypothetical protein